MDTAKFISPKFLWGIALVIAIVALLQPIRTPTPDIALVAASTPTPSPAFLTPASTPAMAPSDQAADLYLRVIETSDRTIESIRGVATVVLAAVGIVVTAVTIVVGIVGALAGYRSKVAGDQAAEARAQASEANVKAAFAQELLKRAEEKAARVENTVSDLQLKATRLDQDICAARSAIQELTQVASREQSRLDAINRDIDSLRQQAENVRRALSLFDESDLRFLATLRLIDKYRKTLFATSDLRSRQQAEWALLAKASADSPLIRRESVIALSGVATPTEAIIEQFVYMASEDTDPQVRKLVQAALEDWQIIPGSE